MLETFSLSTFSPRLGKKFAVRLDGAKRLELELVEATALDGEPMNGRVPFSLVFRVPRTFYCRSEYIPSSTKPWARLKFSSCLSVWTKRVCATRPFSPD